jgi:hypothetical protein
MTPNHDQLYEVYELYLSRRKPGDPYWTFSGWLQHARLSTRLPADEGRIRPHCMGAEFPPRLPVNPDLGPMQRKCLAGPLLTARQVVSKLTGVPDEALVTLNSTVQQAGFEKQKAEASRLRNSDLLTTRW